MELRHLRTFTLVAATGSFRKAALQLGLSQPTLTRQVQEIERELGVAIFDRTKRPTALTPAGASFLPVASGVLKQLDDARLRLIDFAATGLRIAAAPWAYAYIPHLIKAFEEQHGHIPLALTRYVDNRQAVEQLTSGAVDAAFLFNNPDVSVELPGVTRLPLVREPYGFVLPRDHEMAGRDQVQVPDMAGCEFIVSDYADQRYALQRAMQSTGAKPKVTIQARQEMMMALVEQGLGVGITTRTVARHTNFKVAFVRIADEFLTTEMSIAWPSDRPPSPALQKLIDFARANVHLIAVEDAIPL